MPYLLVILTILALTSCSTKRNYESFENKIAKIEKNHDCKIGLSAVYMEKNQVLSHRENERFIMASTVKIPIAVYLLHLAEKNPMLLDKMIRVDPPDLSPGSGYLGYFLSRPGLEISIYNLLEPMLAISDNSATDIILKNIGGTKAVYNYLLKHHLQDIQVSRTMLQIFIDTNDLPYIPPPHTLNLAGWIKLFSVKTAKIPSIYQKFDQDPRDTTTPIAMTNMLMKIVNAEILSKKNSERLIDILIRAKCGPERIRKALPKDYLLASKSGAWWNREGSDIKYTYTNDVGIVILPNKEHIVLSIFVRSTNDKTDTKKQKEIIAEVARKIFNDFKN